MSVSALVPVAVTAILIVSLPLVKPGSGWWVGERSSAYGPSAALPPAASWNQPLFPSPPQLQVWGQFLSQASPRPFGGGGGGGGDEP